MKKEIRNRIVYHGTSKENTEIIKRNGFKPNTYFALHLEDALEFGGEYIFYVILECDDKNWQPRPARKVSKNRITRLIKVNPKMLYENDEAIIGYFGKGEKYPCPNCKADIGRVRLSTFGKPTKPKCPKCRKTFKELFSSSPTRADY